MSDKDQDFVPLLGGVGALDDLFSSIKGITTRDEKHAIVNRMGSMEQNDLDESRPVMNSIVKRFALTQDLDEAAIISRFFLFRIELGINIEEEAKQAASIKALSLLALNDFADHPYIGTHAGSYFILSSLLPSDPLVRKQVVDHFALKLSTDKDSDDAAIAIIYGRKRQLLGLFDDYLPKYFTNIGLSQLDSASIAGLFQRRILTLGEFEYAQEEQDLIERARERYQNVQSKTHVGGFIFSLLNDSPNLVSVID